ARSAGAGKAAPPLSAARPVGGILVCSATRSYLGSAFRLRMRRSVHIRGKDTPVRSFVVLGQSMAVRRGAASEQHLGREAELQSLSDGLAPLRSGTRAVIDLEGSMGIGKSALVQALRRSAAARSAGWLNVACPPYGQDLPYTTLAGLLRGLLQRIERFESLELESILAASLD